MNLQVNSNKGVCELSGSFTDTNASLIEMHLSDLIDRCEEIFVSLYKVDKIDASALDAMSDLYEKAMKQKKQLFFYGCKRMKVDTLFKYGKLQFIFKE